MRVHPLRAVVALVVTCMAAAMLAVLPMSVAHAAARVDVSVTPSASGPTKVTLTGTGFQYQPNAPGGVYVFFGAVQDPSTNSWAPSQGGKSGRTFGYAATPGAQLLVAFQGGSSASASNSMIRPDGSWQAEMTIPGASFQSTSGNPHAGETQQGETINCLQVQCGIITIGAHGMINANNESFTPVSFVTESGQIQSGSAAPKFNDDPTQLTLPKNGKDKEKTGAAHATELAKKAKAKQQAEQRKAAQKPAATGNTWLVIGVFVAAVLVLLAALTAFFVMKQRQRRAEAARAGAAAGTADPPASRTDG